MLYRMYTRWAERHGFTYKIMDAEPWTWNMICEDGVYYHVDLTQCKENGGFREKADADMKGYVWDYSAFPACGTTGESTASEG